MLAFWDLQAENLPKDRQTLNSSKLTLQVVPSIIPIARRFATEGWQEHFRVVSVLA